MAGRPAPNTRWPGRGGRPPGARPQVGGRPGPARVLRFDATQRAAHWLTALLFLILMATGLALFLPSIAVLVGRRELVARIHLWTGVVLPVALAATLIGPWGAAMRRDLRRIDLWTKDELRWLRSLGTDRPPVVDKFNPGQKLNAIFVGSAVIVMLASGAVLQWFGLFPLGWRTGATFVHDLVALMVFVVVLGHVLFALTHRDALRAMIFGWVTEPWARRHAPGWLREIEASAGRPPPGATVREDAGGDGA